MDADAVQIERFGSGHINDTFLVTDGRRYILQRLNTEVFRDPMLVIENIEGVTRFLRAKIEAAGGDPDRETLNLIHTREEKPYYIDAEGNFWRMYLFIEGATSYDAVKKPEDFYHSAEAFGHFQYQLSDYPAHTLHETIPAFHDTPKRYRDFQKAVQEDVCHRAASVEKEIRFVEERAAEMGLAMDMLREGRLPLRVTHNDTKLNNIMIDDKTGRAVCVIDLDTVMPGLSIFDFGDSIRFGANTAVEDEQDLSKVSLSLPLYETYVDGFLTGCGGALTDEERRMLPQGARLMTLECGMRFLADYLQGDTYFQIHRENHNLDRCRTQFGLVADMERKWDAMENAVAR
ncbi:MAG: aminoglycoside phosphotransferase family protein [Eubacteriales bacterium]|nr:aminoglycoside phosphotransferase family protein [Eubacteriales bacterium]